MDYFWMINMKTITHTIGTTIIIKHFAYEFVKQLRRYVKTDYKIPDPRKGHMHCDAIGFGRNDVHV